ncbi:ABC transporter permease [Paenibacillus anaericanus]|uniref:ABC transporter permease n=1 Tax=Paenibacillus anaericanus TaxID=170367 RepID=A0A3S1BLH1_9BACL|nr:ABC transporter permease [Paenibacillus anaericanus]RUT44412.1 ABC transporter permease [Paenibacillus anaericanus]
MRLLAVFKKSLIEQIRDYKALVLTLLSPVIFIVIFGLAFGQGFYTYTLGISNDDVGVMGEKLIYEFQNSKYPNGNLMFSVVMVDYDTEQVLNGIKKQKYDAHLYIPSDFSESLHNSGQGGETSSVRVPITGNPSYISYNLISSFVENHIHNFVWTKGMVDNPIEIVYEETESTKIKSEFENMAPGLMVFSVFFLLILSSMVVTKEVENRTIQRIVLSKIKPFEIYAGVSLSQLLLAVVMLPMVFATSLMLGFTTTGSFGLAYLVGLIATFSAIGIGMIISAFCKTSLEAFIIGNVVVTPMMFLAGIFFKVPPVKLFTIMGKEIELLTLMPTLDAVNAMNKILINDADFFGILPELIVLTLLSAGYFMLGVYLFSRRYMRKA